MKLPDLPFKLPDMPRKAAIGFGLVGTSLVLFVALFFTLGTWRDNAIQENADLKNNLAKSKANLEQSQTDVKFVSENRESYERLLQSDQLVPHTRLTAVRRMQEVAQIHGLTQLNYDFNTAADTSLTAVASQPTSGDYRVNVEAIKLNVGAPVDGKIYGFLYDVADNFPGAIVVQSVSLTRAPKVSSEMLDLVSQNQDSGLVKGEVLLLWRTAQSTDKKAEQK
jgi:hypothetical protein